MNIAVIFAGGSGIRMNAGTLPKQFLDYNGKPILIYTLELFDKHPDVGGIVVACLKDWIPFLEEKVLQFGIRKVMGIVPGGKTGQESIYFALEEADRLRQNAIDKDDDIVLIHDGVRPLIREKTIADNLEYVRSKGNCITCVPATESAIIYAKDGTIDMPSRPDMLMVRAPQSFYLKDILSAHRRAVSEGRNDFIDCCTMMHHYRWNVNPYIGPAENIKITTPSDYYVFKAFVEARDNSNNYGVL